MILKGCPGVACESTGSEARIEVSRTSSKRIGSERGRLGDVRRVGRVGSSERVDTPRGEGDRAKDAQDRERDLSRLCAKI
jgi:hypothetical protein